MNIEDVNTKAGEDSGVRPLISYGNPLDQQRYIYTLNNVKDKLVCDVASGVGWGVYLMAMSGAKKVVGIDISKNVIEISKQYFSHELVNFINCAVENFLAKEKFDVITSFETIEHVDNPQKFLESLRMIINEGGVFYLSTPNPACTGTQINGAPHNPFHWREYSRLELEEMFLNTGWEVEDYLGQYWIKKDSKEIFEYAEFNKKYWKSIDLRVKWGWVYRLYSFAKRLVFGVDVDPASNSPRIISYKVDHEPVYHYYKLRPARPSL